MSYFRETWRPKNIKCSAPSALSGILDRRGLGDLGKLPLELLIEVFKHVPFRPRLKATLLVSKRLQGLIHEKSLWRKIETDKALVGPTLAYMIQPGVSGAVGGEEPLLPRGNVEGLAIDMAYCTTGDVIALLKRLRTQHHNAFTTLSLTGPWPLLTTTALHLSRQASRGTLDLTRLTHLSLSLDSHHDPSCALQPTDLGAFLSALPNLLHLVMQRAGPTPSASSYSNVELLIDEALLHRIAAPRLRTLVAPLWVLSLSAAVHLGTCFPLLERLCVGMTVSGKDSAGAGAAVVPLPRLRSAKLAYWERCRYAGAEEELEERVARFFIGFVGAAPGLRELEFKRANVVGGGGGGVELDLFRRVWGSGGRVESLEMVVVRLEGWAVVAAEGVERVWRCPVLVEAPWLWVDVGRRIRRRRRRVRGRRERWREEWKGKKKRRRRQE